MERRVYLRYKTDDKCCVAKLVTEENVTLKDISMGGIKLQTSQNLAPNRIFRVEIVSGDNETIVPTCEVVWTSLLQSIEENDSSYSIYRVGLKFIKLTSEEKDFLEKHINILSSGSHAGN